MSACEALPKAVWKAQRRLQRGVLGLPVASKLDQKSIHIFTKFSMRSLGRCGVSTPLTRPGPTPAAWVLGTFRPGSVKTHCVFTHFKKHRFCHPVYFLFLWFSLSLLRRGDAAGFNRLTPFRRPLYVSRAAFSKLFSAISRVSRAFQGLLEGFWTGSGGSWRGLGAILELFWTFPWASLIPNG